MNRRIPLVVLTLALLSGCTPMGENIAHRGGFAPRIREGTRLTPLGSARMLRDTPGEGALDAPTRLTILTYGPAIKRCAMDYGFDWRLVLAIMKQESSFESDAESRKGATGLMQLMPPTQREVAERLDLDDSTHPAVNIRIGVYYLRTLYSMFAGAEEADRLKLMLASYNAGIGRVHDAQEIAAYLGDSPVKWQAVKTALPFLSRRYASLHGSVWEDGRPRNGSFGGARETVAYVDGVVSQYETYLRALN